MSQIVLRRSGGFCTPWHLPDGHQSRNGPPSHQIDPPCHRAFKIGKTAKVQLVLDQIWSKTCSKPPSTFYFTPSLALLWIMDFPLGREPSVEIPLGDARESPLAQLEFQPKFFDQEVIFFVFSIVTSSYIPKTWTWHQHLTIKPLENIRRPMSDFSASGFHHFASAFANAMKSMKGTFRERWCSHGPWAGPCLVKTHESYTAYCVYRMLYNIIYIILYIYNIV